MPHQTIRRPDKLRYKGRILQEVPLKERWERELDIDPLTGHARRLHSENYNVMQRRRNLMEKKKKRKLQDKYRAMEMKRRD